MNKVAQRVLLIAIAVAAFYGVRALREAGTSQQVTSEELVEHVDDLAARAEKAHPDLAKSDAMKAQASLESAEKFAAQTPVERRNTAAHMFWGFYYVNTEVRAEYCKERGVDLAPFVNAFAETHKDAHKRATEVFAKIGIDPNTLREPLRAVTASVVEQDMKDVTSGAQVPLDQACDLFNAHAVAMAEYLQPPPHVQEALMADISDPNDRATEAPSLL